MLKKVHNAKTKDKKVRILRENDSDALRMVIKGSFDPNIEWVLPEGEVPYNKNEAPDGTEHTLLFQESKKVVEIHQRCRQQDPTMEEGANVRSDIRRSVSR